jgi:glycosyltransferase involved in cell wall biosynthesis
MSTHIPRERPRRVVYVVCPSGQPGGGMGQLGEYLAARGTDSSGRFRLVRVDSRGAGHIAWSPFYLALAAARIVIGAVRGDLAIVHLSLAERGSVIRKGILLLVARLCGVRVLLHLHAGHIIAFYDGASAPMRFLLRRMFRSASHCVVLGELWRGWVVRAMGIPAHAVTVVDNGVPVAPVPHEPAPDGASFRLLFLGNLLEPKGIGDLLEALARPEALDAALVLTLAGGGAVDRYREMAARLGIGDRVRFTGWVDQPTARRLLAQSDALVLPSYGEGLPLVVLEAMAAGVPVICTPVGAVPEVWEDRRNALFVRPGDQAGIAGAVLELSCDPALCESLATEGLALYRQRFTMDGFLRRISDVYAATAKPATELACRQRAPATIQEARHDR